MKWVTSLSTKISLEAAVQDLSQQIFACATPTTSAMPMRGVYWNGPVPDGNALGVSQISSVSWPTRALLKQRSTLNC